jgi:hypothetical protein
MEDPISSCPMNFAANAPITGYARTWGDAASRGSHRVSRWSSWGVALVDILHKSCYKDLLSKLIYTHV